MDEKERNFQEMYAEFQSLDQHIKQLHKQLEIITQQFIELSVTGNSLDEFNRIKDGKEVFVPLSSGIFAKARISDTSEVLVNVGANIVVKKDVPSAKALITHQVEELQKLQKEVVEEIDRMTTRAAQIESQLRGLMSEGVNS